MIPLLFLFAASADLDALNNAVPRCHRRTANPVFAAEQAQRSASILEAYRDQEAIVALRLAVSQKRAAMREAGKILAADEKKVWLEEAAIEDRQRARNDKRMLDGLRRDAMDTMRRYFLLNCPAGQTDK